MNNKGLIFNIQRFSIHDGPGIRTTVFLKGCPLRCPWCANPESRTTEIQLLHTSANCAACLRCISVCPQHGLSMTDGKLIHTPELCTHCLSCVHACPTHALTAEGAWYTIDEIMKEVEKDSPFYEKSNGGITLSGGEPLMQEEFTYNLLKTLKQTGYHTNIETSGYTSSEYLLKILPYLDLIYMDFKHPNDNQHIQKVGVSNKQILKNMELILQSNKSLIVRIPVIPRFNNSTDTAHEYGIKLKKLHAKKVHLLPFHQMGLGKWHSLGLNYEYESDKSMREEELTNIATILASYGLDIQIGGT